MPHKNIIAVYCAMQSNSIIIDLIDSTSRHCENKSVERNKKRMDKWISYRFPDIAISLQ